MNLPVSPGSNGILDDVSTFAEILLNLFSPKAEDNPALFLEHLVDLPIAFDIAFNLGNPEFSVGYDVIFTMFPVISVPELAVAKYCDLFSDEGDVWFAWYCF